MNAPPEAPLRIPPQDVVAESTVLGSMMLESARVAEVADILRADDFYRPAHQTIYRVLLDMHAAGEPIDLVTVRAKLATLGELEQVGDTEYVAGLVAGTPSAANAGYYARIVRDCSIRRAIIVAASDWQADGFAHDMTTDELLADVQRRVYEVSLRAAGNAGGTETVATFGEAAGLAMQHARDVVNGDKAVGLLFGKGFEPLDDVLGGLQAGDLVVLAGDTGKGKSTLAGQLALRLADDAGARVLLVSREMRPKEVGKRLLQVRASVAGDMMKRPWEWDDASWAALDQHVEQLNGLRAIVDSRSSEIGQIATRARSLATQWGGLDLIVIDHAQLCHGEGDSRAQQIGAVAWGAKALAMDLGCVVMLVSQFARRPEQATRPPTIACLKECVPGDTLVTLADGTRRPISEVVRGNRVQSWNAVAGTFEAAPVAEVIRKGTNTVFAVRLRSGRVLRATAAHPVWGECGWVPVSSLVPGSLIGVPRQFRHRQTAPGPSLLRARLAKRDIYTLTPTRASHPLFAAMPLGGHKSSLLAKAVAMRSHDRNTGGERLPWQATRDYAAICSELGRSRNSVGYILQGKRMCRPAARRLTALLGSERMAWWSEHDLNWDEVVSVTEIGPQEVWDLRVEGNHSFVADGVLVHNSGDLENDANMILLLYAPPAVRMIDAAQGVQELWLQIGKQRDGRVTPWDRVGALRLAWDRPRTRFLSVRAVTTMDTITGSD